MLSLTHMPPGRRLSTPCCHEQPRKGQSVPSKTPNAVSPDWAAGPGAGARTGTAAACGAVATAPMTALLRSGGPVAMAAARGAAGACKLTKHCCPQEIDWCELGLAAGYTDDAAEIIPVRLYEEGVPEGQCVANPLHAIRLLEQRQKRPDLEQARRQWRCCR